MRVAVTAASASTSRPACANALRYSVVSATSASLRGEPRLSSVIVMPDDNLGSPRSVALVALTTEYRKAFAQAGLDVDADAAVTATRIRASALADKTVSALDTWALAAFLLKREAEQQKLLQIARLADPDPAWGDRLRDPAAWGDQQKLILLAEEALAATRPLPAHQPGILASLLKQRGSRSEGMHLLREALRRRPNDFWLNWEMAVAHCSGGDFKQAIPFLRTLIALRPDNPWTNHHLGVALMMSGEMDEAVAQFRYAMKLDPKNEVTQRSLAHALLKAGKPAEALQVAQLLLEAEPNNANAVVT